MGLFAEWLFAESLRITLRRSISKVPRRYLSQGMKLVEFCRDAELGPDDARDVIMYVVSSQG